MKLTRELSAAFWMIALDTDNLFGNLPFNFPV